MSGLINRLKKEIKSSAAKRALIYALVFGAMLGIALVTGYQFKISGMTAPGVKGKALITLKGCLLSVLFLPVTYMLFRSLDVCAAVRKNGQDDASGKKSLSGLMKILKTGSHGKMKPVKAGLISWIIIWLCWLPAFLAYYPAIMSYDFHRQFGEAVKGYVWFYEYQPLVHTFLIRMFWLLGLKLGNVAAGLAAFAILQSLVLSASMAAGISYVYRRSGMAPAVIWTMFFALLPFNPVLAISMTKDILFSSFFALLILIVIMMEEKKSILLYAAFIVIGILNILFRNNAAYALIFLIPAFLIGKKNIKDKLLNAGLAVIVVVAGLGCKTLIRETMHAIPGNEIEKYSVPIMQMVRVTAYQADNLTPEQEEILRRYIDESSWGEYYAPIADSAKSGVSAYRSAAWTEGGIRLIEDYLTIAKAYPNDYIDAFIGLTAGYWSFFDLSHAEMLDVGDDTGYGLLFTFNSSVNEMYPDGIPNASFLPGLRDRYAHIVNGNSYYHWPVISLLFKPATYFWMFVFVCLAALYRKKSGSAAVLAYPLFYLMTMLLGPCVHFRYMYPYVVVMPVLIAFVLAGRSAQKKPE